jgi:SAM-dependent methyltransferase
MSDFFLAGLLDAALSHGEDETGEDLNVQRIMRELHRVLKPNGKYLLFSGNDSFITLPYFVGDDAVEWTVTDPVVVNGQRRKGQKVTRTLFFYLLEAVKK